MPHFNLEIYCDPGICPFSEHCKAYLQKLGYGALKKQVPRCGWNLSYPESDPDREAPRETNSRRFLANTNSS